MMILAKKVLLTFLFVFYFIGIFAQELDFRKRYQQIDSLLNEKSFFGNHLTGFILFDLDSNTVLFEQNGQINFIPASTTKLFTFYGSLMALPDSIVGMRYVENGDQITIWGTGYPGWKYDKLPKDNISEFLSRFKSIQFSDQNWKETAFGYGWQWDDYYYSYSAEKSPFPIHGNLVTYTNQKRTPNSNIPIFGKVRVEAKSDQKGVTRELLTNTFYFNPEKYTESKSEVPFITSPVLFTQLASESLDIPVSLVNEALPSIHREFKIGRMKPLWIEMLQESDNFIAEQMLLMIGERQFAELNSERAIEYIQKTYLSDLPDQPKWVDGSGLSRHNLTTPRSMISLLLKIEKEIPRVELMNLLPQGGINGTLKNNYKARKPYIFAKTGTVANNHALIGYVKTDSGKTLAFAFMNNNYLQQASQVRREMEKVMVYVKENF